MCKIKVQPINMTDFKRKKQTVQAEMVYSQVQPQIVELEEAVLGALLLESSIFDTIGKDFSPNLFYKEANILVATAIVEMFRANEAIDILTVSQKLKANGELEKVGGAYYVSALTNRIASSANIEHHIKLLQQYTLKRSLIKICGGAVQKAYSDHDDIFDTYTDVQVSVDDALKQVLNYDVASIKDIHLQGLAESREVANGQGVSGVETGLKMVDRLTSGWQKSDLIILAGRPAMGKTAMALSMVVNPSIKKDIPVAIFSLEMSKQQLGGRIQSNLSGVDVSKIIKKQLDLGDIDYIEKNCIKLLTSPLYIDDTPNISLIELKSKARRLVREKGVRLIVIDYLQLMRSGLNIMNREQEIAEISRGLKGLAKELEIPIVALSQLSRLVEGRSDKKPQLSDLRESGQIEQDADMVMFCYRPEYYGVDTYEINSESIEASGLFMLIIAKHRNGELGEVPLRFIHSLAKITNHPHWVREQEESESIVNLVPSPTGGGFTQIEQNDDFLNQKNQPQQQKEDENDLLPF